MRKDAGNSWRCFALLLVALAGSIAPGIAGDSVLTGRVTNTEGAEIGGVMLFLAAVGRVSPPGPGGAATKFLESSSDGSFVTILPAGRYVVAASKPGYEVALTEVSTLIRGVLEVRLRESARIVLGDLPDAPPGENPGLSWILRSPSNDVLRETEASLPLAGTTTVRAAPPSRAGWLQAILQPIDGELVQHFSGAALLGQEAAGPSDTSGRSTSLALRGAIGDQGSWRFDGLTGRLSTGPAEGAAGPRQGRRADRMQFGFDYRLGPDDTLEADLRYGTSRYVVDPNGETVNATDQDETNVGLRSRWNRKLGEAGLLYVEGSYVETGVRVPDAGGSPLVSLTGQEGTASRVTDRSTLAAAGLAVDAGRHRLDFGIRTKSYRYDLRDRGVLLYTLYDAPTLTEPGEGGQAMSLFGSDDWRLGGRSTLNYGLRYHSNLSAGNAYLVPRLGLTFEPAEAGGTRFRSQLLFRLDDPGLSSLYSTAEERREVERRDVARFGYLLGVERRPDDRLGFAATLSYKPFEEGVGGEDGGVVAPGAWGDALLFLTDGAAGRHELGVEIGRAFGEVRGSLSGTVGRVEGRLTPAVEEAPVQVLSLGEVRYYLTRLRALYGPTETEVQVDYRSVQAEGGVPESFDPEGSVAYRRIDLTVAQDLPRISGAMNARFKVLMAYQGLVYGSSYEGARALPGATSRWTGGVDIRF